MERREIGFKLAMDAWKLPVRVDNFDDRLILQKAVYLGQAAGVHLGYHYRWYLRGPYCPAVAEDAFAVSLEESDETVGWALDVTSTTRLEGLRNMVAIEDRAKLARKLELLASVHFLIDRKQVRGQSPEKIAAILEKYGKEFDESDVTNALEELKAHEILR